jgi:hypothetical protein
MKNAASTSGWVVSVQPLWQSYAAAMLIPGLQRVKGT